MTNSDAIYEEQKRKIVNNALTTSAMFSYVFCKFFYLFLLFLREWGMERVYKNASNKSSENSGLNFLKITSY